MALYLGKDKIAGTNTSSIIGDTLPVGAVIDYDGEEVPANWELVEDNETNNSGAIILKTTDSRAEKYAKLWNAIQPYDLGDGEDLPMATFSIPVIYEYYTPDGDYIYMNMRSASAQWETGPVFNMEYTDGKERYWGVLVLDVINQVIRSEAMDSVESVGTEVTIRDNLTSTETSAALSANQGKVLNDLIAELTARVAALEELHVLPTFIFDGDDYGTLTFSFEEGMTWGDFVASEYNTDNFFEVDGNMIKITNPISKVPYIIDRNLTGNYYVYTTTELVADRHYTYSTDPV